MLSSAFTLAAALSFGLIAARRHAAPRARRVFRVVVVRETAARLAAGAQTRPRSEQLRFVEDREQRGNRSLVFRFELEATVRVDARLRRVLAKKGGIALPGRRRIALPLLAKSRSRSVSRKSRNCARWPSSLDGRQPVAQAPGPRPSRANRARRDHSAGRSCSRTAGSARGRPAPRRRRASPFP